MVTTVSVTMFYIGNFADMDTDETDSDNENPNIVLGTYGDLDERTVTEVDVDDDGVIADDEFATGDYIEYDVGGGTTSVALDSTSLYNATILLGDGSSITRTVLVIQSANGDVFISEYPPEPLDGLSIQSITLDSLNSSEAMGINQGFSSVENTSVVCFGLGTRILTPTGEIMVEALKIGDLVETLDHGAQPVTWTHRSLKMRPARNAAIRLAPGALGRNLPETELRLSPQHRLLVRSRIANRMFGTSEVLIAAKDLLPLPHVSQTLQFIPTVYCHFACKNHEIVTANGIHVETFFAGTTAINLLGGGAAKSLPDTLVKSIPARLIVKGQKARTLIARHRKNSVPVQAQTGQSLTIV